MVEQRDVEIILNNPIDWEQFRNKTVLVTGATDRKSTRLNSSHNRESRMPSSA